MKYATLKIVVKELQCVLANSTGKTSVKEPSLLSRLPQFSRGDRLEYDKRYMMDT